MILVSAGIYALILIAALAIVASTKFTGQKQPVFKFKPVTDEFAEAVKLLHKARFEVGADLRKRINAFLTGHE